MVQVNWKAGIIDVFKTDMSLVQPSPETWELDLNELHLALRTLEASEEGAPWPDTHVHDTEAVITGTTYARRVRILPPYTLQFEDGQYTVRAVGANHNILDVKIANQVSVLVQNSAGLTSPGFTATDSANLTLARKMASNRLEVDFVLQQLVLYDDDGLTVLKRWPLETAGGEAVQSAKGVQTKRGKPL